MGAGNWTAVIASWKGAALWCDAGWGCPPPFVCSGSECIQKTQLTSMSRGPHKLVWKPEKNLYPTCFNFQYFNTSILGPFYYKRNRSISEDLTNSHRFRKQEDIIRGRTINIINNLICIIVRVQRTEKSILRSPPAHKMKRLYPTYIFPKPVLRSLAQKQIAREDFA